MNIYQTLNNLKDKQQTERKQAKYIYLDEGTKQIKEGRLDCAGAALVNQVNAVKLVHKFMFGY